MLKCGVIHQYFGYEVKGHFDGGMRNYGNYSEGVKK